MSEYRKDPVLNQWVIIAPEKTISYPAIKEQAIPENLPEFDENCPFCKFNGEDTKILLKYDFRNNGKWDLLVIPAPNPFLRVETELQKEGEGIFDLMSGTGANEIIIESPKHNEFTYKMDLNRVEQIFWAYHDRIVDLKNDKRLEYLLFFKEFGITPENKIIHPHSKMIATTFIPAHIELELLSAEDYFSYKDRCVFCDIVKQERKEGIRVISQNEDFISICPYASRFPFEIWILPQKHISHFEMSSKIMFYHLAEIYLDTFKRLNKVLGNVPYHTVLHTSPVQEESLEFYHWHIEIYPILNCYSAPQSGGGIFVNPVKPEDAAKALREATF
ncbi:UDPglucose--hexose-1-phosphate uridylyltransferase [Thermotomaculum hydrothermale]|uniref:Galactose-1-phosphate uridylyltransferase n=1 Tax=Thermotomaculum hydrothermale TaxID=981385 RepID=A0A7R6PMG5_9BACT|nr:galactose-1-phosphate uridylyltransferase [Thermotomaculum hydrothermale]BBB31821.1 UDPglucose--hexose-1-phosphate uridylyltransferase [Thermotomaculum hydrothermale]